ncbi:HVO_A0114 family putative DNA-binding protein [Achromobacter sp. AGC39]
MTMDRTLTITIDQDWRAFLADAGRRAKQGLAAGGYQGERLNFESPAAFFGQLTELRWNIVREMLGAGQVGIRELARRLGRDVRRVHGDTKALVDLGLLEKADDGSVICPFADIHIDMHLTQNFPAAA